MVISTYKILKVRQDHHKFTWLFFICISPVLTRSVYEVYRRWFAKKIGVMAVETKSPTSSRVLLILSVVMFVISVVFSAISVIDIGIGYIKSYVDNEPIAAAYDVNGKEYFDYFEVPLYDREGNVYTYEPDWFTVGDYTDQNGKAYDGDYCYLDQDGYFYFDAADALFPHPNYDGYYTDGDEIYYSLWGYVYWDEDGIPYEKSGRFSIELFDFIE